MYPLTLAFYTRDLAKIWLFYSALGIRWNPGSNQMPSAVPPGDDPPEEIMGFMEPELMGQLAGASIWFLYDADAEPASDCIVFKIEYESGPAMKAAVQKLKDYDLFSPESGFRIRGGIVRDPDNRRIHLRQPDLHRIVEVKKQDI